MRRLALAALLLLAAAGPPTPDQLKAAERARAADLAAQQAAAAQARAAAEQERTLADQRVAAAEKLRQAEDALAQAAARVADLAQQRRQAEADLAARAAALAPMLPVIERLSLYPAETLLAVPMPPEDAVRGVLVLGGVTQTLEHEAAALREEQAHAADLQKALDAALPGLAQARAEQAQLAQTLDAEIADAQQAHQSAQDAVAAAARRAAADAARAAGIRTAIARLDAERQAAAEPPPTAPPAEAPPQQQAMTQPGGSVGEARGQLTAPVAGSVARAYGAATDAGPATGVSYQAPPNARVVSPCAGRVAFAGPFRSFGLLIILDCGLGYDFVLSGLDRLDVQVGQAVLAGEPVGVMPGWDPQTAGANRPTLYMELRKDGVPVNPGPFLRARS